MFDRFGVVITLMELVDINSKIGNIIEKCPSCGEKNIIYSTSCGSCGFSWENYYNQELKKRYGNSNASKN